MSGPVVDWPAVRLVVFDMDGTLYAQRPVRLAMAGALAFEAVRTRSLSTLRLVADYRRAREALAGEAGNMFGEALVARLALAHGRAPEETGAALGEWLHRRPLAAVARARRRGAVPLFRALRRSGRAVAVWSDYPAEAKLAALGLEADAVVDAAHPGVSALKPDPAGLVWLMRHFGVGPEATLMVGDRDERDGAAARAAGVPALILGRDGLSGLDAQMFRPVLAS